MIEQYLREGLGWSEKTADAFAADIEKAMPHLRDFLDGDSPRNMPTPIPPRKLPTGVGKYSHYKKQLENIGSAIEQLDGVPLWYMQEYLAKKFDPDYSGSFISSYHLHAKAKAIIENLSLIREAAQETAPGFDNGGWIKKRMSKKNPHGHDLCLNMVLGLIADHDPEIVSAKRNPEQFHFLKWLVEETFKSIDPGQKKLSNIANRINAQIESGLHDARSYCLNEDSTVTKEELNSLEAETLKHSENQNPPNS